MYATHFDLINSQLSTNSSINFDLEQLTAEFEQKFNTIFSRLDLIENKLNKCISKIELIEKNIEFDNSRIELLKKDVSELVNKDLNETNNEFTIKRLIQEQEKIRNQINSQI